MAKLVSKTYGDALFAVACEEECIDEFFEAAVCVVDSLWANEEFIKLMNHPNIGKEEKIKIVEETFSQKIPKEIIGLMTLLIKKGHAKDMCAVFKYFIGLVKEEKKIGSARVVTAIELSGEQKEKVEQKLLETTSYEKFEMNYEVDSSLIGGMVIRIGDRIVDSSIRTKLYELSKNLRKIQL